jgi:polyhydroxyalkanoate synthesis regulator phasin
MIEDTLEKLEKRLADAATLSEEQRSALQDLVTQLKSEIDALDDEDHADRIAGFTEAGTREALREQTDMDLLDLNLEGMRRSVRHFEASHPNLISVVNSVCRQLSNLGI